MAALEQEEDGMCFAARCGWMACGRTGGHGEGGVRSPAAGRVCECCCTTLGVLAVARGLCMVFCCLGVPRNSDGTGHEDHYSSMISPFGAFGYFPEKWTACPKGFVIQMKFRKRNRKNMK